MMDSEKLLMDLHAFEVFNSFNSSKIYVLFIDMFVVQIDDSVKFYPASTCHAVYE